LTYSPLPLAESFAAAILVFGACLAGVSVVNRLRGKNYLRRILGRYERGQSATRPGLFFRGQKLRTAPPKSNQFLVRVDEQLAAAGLFIDAKVWLAGAGCLGALIGLFVAITLTSVGLGVIAGGAVTTLLWFQYLPSRIARRRTLFAKQLPRALQTIASSLRAGSTVQGGIANFVNTQGGEVSAQLERALAEVQFGADLGEALARVAERMKSADLKWFVLALEIHREVGGALNELVDGVAQTMLARSEIARERKVITAEGRLSGLVLMALPFIEIVALQMLRPGYLDFFWNGPIGLMSLLVFAALMFSGWVWLRAIIGGEK
jgi:tight adherence protein B